MCTILAIQYFGAILNDPVPCKPLLTYIPFGGFGVPKHLLRISTLAVKLFSPILCWKKRCAFVKHQSLSLIFRKCVTYVQSEICNPLSDGVMR